MGDWRGRGGGVDGVGEGWWNGRVTGFAFELESDGMSFLSRLRSEDLDRLRE